VGSVLQFPVRSAAPPPAKPDSIRLEAQHWERRHGRDAYSAFLLKHGARPSPAQAEVIGKVVGRRIKASDGFRYPRLNHALVRSDDRKKWEKIKSLLRATGEGRKTDIDREGPQPAS
jgi:hypothetical protein